MSFTTDVKKEIINRGIGVGGAGGQAAKKAALSAFISTSGIMGIKDGEANFFIVSETENVAEFFMQLFTETFGFDLSITNATMDRMSGRDKLLLQCSTSEQKSVLNTLGFLKRSGEFRNGLSNALIKEDSQKIAYIQGAFLGGGSCILPNENGKTSYHLEIVFSDKKTARDFCDLLSELELLVKLTERKETHVVYIKSKEMISDFLALIGAEHALKRFSVFLDKRDEANHYNRTLNCMAGNADKAAKAAIKQVMAIETLQHTGALAELGEELQQLATARMAHKGMSMQELADYLKVSKSCLNHRMRRLLEEAEKQTNNNEK